MQNILTLLIFLLLPLLALPQVAAGEKDLVKVKKKLVKSVLGESDRYWSSLPAAPVEFKGAVVSIPALNVFKTEVTNIQYRAFLYDLAKSGKAQELAKAAVDSAQWSLLPFDTSATSNMKNMYFSHPVYDHYPVVNISREAALLFCRWLSEECNLQGKRNDIQVRLPEDSEWAYAARGARDTARFAFGTPATSDSHGVYQCNFRTAGADSSSYIADGALFTNSVNTYKENAFGLFNMCGNAAEMVTVKTGQGEYPATMGGSWNSPEENISINASLENQGVIEPKPYIGFRPVFVAPQKKPFY